MRKIYTCPKSEMNKTSYKIVHGIYLCLWACVKYLPFPFFDYLRYAVLRLFTSTIKATYISDGVTIMFPWRVHIGRNSSINQGCILDGFGNIKIGNSVRIAAYVTINTADHEFSNPEVDIVDQGYVCGAVVIEDNVWIGAHTCINKGVTIGKGSVVGSGSVVVKDIPPYSIAAGNPCNVIRKRN